MRKQDLAKLAQALTRRRELGLSLSIAKDAVAAAVRLPGWRDVEAFPAHVQSVSWDLSAASRIVRRLATRQGLACDCSSLLDILSTFVDEERPLLWPTGPSCGVYLTASEDDVVEWATAYADATAGAPMFGSAIVQGFEGGVELAQEALWSEGLLGLMSGTLLVQGPWRASDTHTLECAERLHQLCVVCLSHPLRVLVWVHAAEGQDVDSWAQRLVQTADPDLGALQSALRPFSLLKAHSSGQQSSSRGSGRANGQPES